MPFIKKAIKGLIYFKETQQLSKWQLIWAKIKWLKERHFFILYCCNSNATFKQKIEAKKSEKNAVGKKSTRMSFFLFLLSFFKTPEKKSDRDVDVKNCEKNHSSNCCSKKVYCF